MKTRWPQYTLLRAASFLAPADQRAEWLAGWQSELWYVPRREANGFCLGAFRDALWLRRNSPSQVRRSGMHLESPLSCLAFLAILAALGSLIAVCLPGPQLGPHSSHLRARDLPAGCIAMLMLAALALPAIRLAMGPDDNRHLLPWRSRLRPGSFLALKIALILPTMFCGFALVCSLSIANLPFNVSWIWALRWLLLDQRRRCPVCLRLLTDPVRIGSASQTFLEWYGAESTCARGHGLLHRSESSASYSANSEWLGLDDSWRSLFRKPWECDDDARTTQRL